MSTHVVNVSSNANNGTNAGTFYLNSNNDSSNANRNLRNSIATKFKAACKKLSIKIQDPARDLSRIMAYKGWVKACNGKRLWRAHTLKLRSTFPKQLRGAI